MRRLIQPVVLAAAAMGVPSSASAAQVGPATDSRARFEQAMSRHASVSESVAAIADCVAGLKAGSTMRPAQLASAGWVQLAPVDSMPQTLRGAGAQTPYAKGHIVLLLHSVGGSAGKPCRLLARATTRATVDQIAAAATARFKVTPLTPTSAFLRRNPGLSAETMRSFLENRDVVLRFKFDAPQPGEPAGSAGYLNIVVAPNV